MRKITMVTGILLFAVVAFNSFAEDRDHTMGHGMSYKMHSMDDERLSLGLSPEMKRHQLANMRAHLDAVQSIIGLLSEGAYDKASHIAHSRLGLTEEMKKMCNSFENKTFKNLGLAFHKSGDALGDALQTNDMTQSLRALNNTMGYCVQCHATFRQ
ncbi:MAG: cytochrome C [Nitrospinales bacterium]